MERLVDWIESGMIHADYACVDALTHPDAALAVDFWQARPADGIRMGRDVPSRAIARLLSRTAIYEPVDSGMDFKVHLAGTSLRQRFGRDVTGESITQLFGAGDLPGRHQALKDVIALNEARMAHIVYSVASVDVLTVELLQMPIIALNGMDRWVLAFAFYF
jgi:hypothetical protein